MTAVLANFLEDAVYEVISPFTGFLFAGVNVVHIDFGWKLSGDDLTQSLD